MKNQYNVYVYGKLDKDQGARWHRVAGIEADTQNEAYQKGREAALAYGLRYGQRELPTAESPSLIENLERETLPVISMFVSDEQLQALDDLTETTARRFIAKHNLED